MHKEILTEEQNTLLPFVAAYSDTFGLVGGTAIALHIGHRRSIDFDLFSFEEFNNTQIKRKIQRQGLTIQKVYKDETGQFTFFIGNVQFTFFHYPFEIAYSDVVDGVVKMPDLLTLAAMKAYALGRRAKWKDYVDLYFIINTFHSIDGIVQRSNEIFKNEFNERIFREHLSYFDDINYTEQVEFLPGFDIRDEEIKKALIEFSIQ